MHLEIRHLKLVAAIAETGSVTRASTRLHLTQSALSHQLRDAEEQLGVPLFERKNGRMTLTSAGERLLQSARTVLAELQRMEADIQKNGLSAKGLIRISTQCNTAYHWFPPRLLAFQKQFPEVEVQLVIEATHHPFEALLDGKLDLAIVCDPIRNSKIRYTPLFEDDVVIAVPPGHRLANKSCVAPEDFLEENLLLYPPERRKHSAHKNSPAGGNSSSQDSRNHTDRSNHRDDHRRPGNCRASEVAYQPAARFWHLDRPAVAAPGLSLELVHRAIARQSLPSLRAGIHPPPRE